MATETTKDAVIVVPSAQQQQIEVSENASGTAVAFKETTSKADVQITGTVVSTGAKVKDSTFTFTEEGSIAFENKVEGSRINATVGDDSVAFGNNVKSVKVDFGIGSDSVAFGGGATVKDTKVKMGVGDGAKDTVVVEDKNDVKSLKITNFGKEDTLIVNGKSFDSNDLQGKDFGGRIIIKFE